MCNHGTYNIIVVKPCDIKNGYVIHIHGSLPNFNILLRQRIIGNSSTEENASVLDQRVTKFYF